ncbi:AP-5 complex subunit beta-1-like [Neltuma alba]|uniref:AP-5 complex subunit beta-1-like n=1 Tax=Neltuma alba TaxID=207710 RepID=UPI0010A5362B|nr:AP-5 complex subunit beta-1-like [Prosopis alba]
MAEKPTPPPLKPLSPLDWETLIDDFQYGGPRCRKWTSLYPFPSLLDLLLNALLRKDFSHSLKIQLLLFLEEFSDSLFDHEHQSHFLDRLINTLRIVIQAPVDGVHITFTFKEQLMVSTTSILICLDEFDKFEARYTVKLVEFLLTMINRPNHGVDRHTRAIACECLRELERANPCLFSEIVGHLWGLCQNERTHASQNYILLFMSVIHNIVAQKLNLSILNTSVPMVPFNVPQWLMGSNKEISGLNYKELRRAIAFLLEWPHVMTPCGMMEFMAMILPVAVALELQSSMLKVQFFGMIYSYDPMLCHVVLMMYLHFLDAFDGQEGEISRRLLLISREAQHYLVFRLLAIQWLLGFSKLIFCKEVGKARSVITLCSAFYPNLFDPLALKALKLDLLALCSICVDILRSGGSSQEEVDSVNPVQLFGDSLVCVSSFKWLPPGSTETAVMFRTLHKFVISSSSHSDYDPSTTTYLLDSKIFCTLEGMLVNMMLDGWRLVPVVVAFVDRFLSCKKHSWLGERLLQKFDEHLLPKLRVDYKLISYFPLFDRISENETIPPLRLLELLSNFMFFLVEKHGPDTGMKSWSHGSRVLGICRTMLVHRHSSRLFLRLSRMLAFTCLFYPDLEVRDNARIYLRMLVCIPGKKLRDILKLGDLIHGVSPSSQSSSFYSVQSPRLSQKFKTFRDLSSCIHLERVIPLLVKQFWSLSLSSFGVSNDKPAYLEGVKDSEAPAEENESPESSNTETIPEMGRISQTQEPLRVTDSKIADILNTLRKYFSCIPDFRCMPGLRVKINCSLRLESSNFIRMLGIDTTALSLEEIDALPAIYATVLKFSSSAPYGPIPSYRIPFLLGERYDNNTSQNLSIVPVENGAKEDKFRASVVIELEPREPTPGVVDVHIETNAENGQIIQGQLRGITVGIEDMFLKAIVPPDIAEDAIPRYKLDLFTALWEACGTSSNTGRETFPLKGSKGVAAISGTRSVKLLDTPVASLVQATERHLACYVVGVTGEPLIDIVRGGGIIQNIIWDDTSDASHDPASAANFDTGPLFLTYKDEDTKGGVSSARKRNLGRILILIVLPPRFHLLFQMEVCDVSTLVRIRTDHWPSLAYIDDYLEALYLS